MTVVGILGTMHDEEVRNECNFSLEVMEKVILEFRPDIICGEIRQEDWENSIVKNQYEGYLGPNEYRKMILPLCKRENIEFVPVDWFEDHMVGSDYLEGKSENEKRDIEMKFEEIGKKYIRIATNSVLPFNSKAFNEFIEEKQDYQQTINPELHKTYWIKRNEMMTSKIKEVIDNSIGKRILCIAGAEHAYMYLSKLEGKNYEVIYPLNNK